MQMAQISGDLVRVVCLGERCDLPLQEFISSVTLLTHGRVCAGREWKSCGTSDRHKDEVTGLTFSWRDWGGPGMRTEELEQVPVLGLTSCCLGGQIKTWEWFWSDAFATDAEGQVTLFAPFVCVSGEHFVECDAK